MEELQKHYVHRQSPKGYGGNRTWHKFYDNCAISQQFPTIQRQNTTLCVHVTYLVMKIAIESLDNLRHVCDNLQQLMALSVPSLSRRPLFDFAGAARSCLEMQQPPDTSSMLFQGSVRVRTPHLETHPPDTIWWTLFRGTWGLPHHPFS